MQRQILSLALLSALLALALSVPLSPVPLPVPDVPRCMQPKVTGLCLASINAYYYNAGTGSCEQFTYGGCQGNDNRFFSEIECMNECGGFELPKIPFELKHEDAEEERSEDESDKK